LNGRLVELYTSILKLAPLMLLKLLAMGAFRPSTSGRGKLQRLVMSSDVLLVISIVAGGVVAALVLGDVMAPTDITRWAVVLAGCVSLLLLAEHMLCEIAVLYNARSGSTPRASGSVDPSITAGGAA
jgi:hypothetical protein